MRILHVGAGFRPWRRGGLVAYVEDLMDAQVAAGHDVAYFFSGRQYPFARGPRVRRWEQRGVRMLEVIDSPLFDHGRQPELEISEPRLDALLDEALDEVRPDVVHVQELAGLPFSVLDVLHRRGLPHLVTLQDYFPVCSTFKLLDAAGRVCTRMEIGEDCAANVRADARHAGILVEGTLDHIVSGTRGLRRYHLRPWMLKGMRRVADAEARRRGTSPAPPEAFQRRREANVARLNRAGAVIAMSHRVGELFAERGVDPARLRTVHLTLAHMEGLTPRVVERPPAPVTFVTLAGFESEAKGAEVLIDALRRLEPLAREGRLRLRVHGHAAPHLRGLDLPGLERRPIFRPEALDAILDDVDVGLVPSVWEEAYGYVGVEFLAKGIPVVANAIGGMPDYTRDGETGWLNRSCSGEELARIMRGIVERPEQVVELNAKLRTNRDAIVKPMPRHAAEMQAIYAECQLNQA